MVDGLFLDIQMPGGSGLELIAELKDPPPVVFVTAYSEHAVRAFDTEAVDYILKPIFKDRLERAIHRLRARQVPVRSGAELLTLTAPPTPAQPARFPVKAGAGLVFLELKRVSHFEVVDEIVWAWSGGKRFRTSWRALSDVESAFPRVEMVRIQRHILLRPEAILGLQSISGNRCKVTVSQGVDLEVSRTVTPRLRERLGLN